MKALCAKKSVNVNSCAFNVSDLSLHVVLNPEAKELLISLLLGQHLRELG